MELSNPAHLRNSVVLSANKAQPGIVYQKAVRLLEKHASRRRGVIPFPEARHVLSWLYHLDKKEAMQFLKELRELKLIEWIPYHGIKILGDSRGNEERRTRA